MCGGKGVAVLGLRVWLRVWRACMACVYGLRVWTACVGCLCMLPALCLCGCCVRVAACVWLPVWVAAVSPLS